MSKITIIEGNSNDKDNVRNYMVKGEKGADGVSPSASVTRGTDKATIEVTDAEGTTSADVLDGYSPTVTASKSNKVTTITIIDKDGTETAEINDGVDLTGGVPTDGLIGFDGVAADIPDGYEVSSTSFATLVNEYSTSTSEGYSANYINNAVKEVYSSTDELVIGTWVDGKPIYRKNIYISSFPNATLVNINISALNMDYLVNLYGYAKESNTKGFPINSTRPDNNTNLIGAWIDGGLYISTALDRSNCSGYVILEYTKTTD